MGVNPERPLDGPEPPFRTFQESWPLFFDYTFELWKVKGIDSQVATDYLFDVLGPGARLRREASKSLMSCGRQG